MQNNKIKKNSKNLQLLQFLVSSSKSPLFLTSKTSCIHSNFIKIPYHLMICEIKNKDENENKNYTSYIKKNLAKNI